MSGLNLLKSIEKALTENHYDCALHEASEELPFEGLVVLLGVDRLGRELAAQISVWEQQSAQGVNYPTEEDSIYNLKIYLPLSLEIKEGTYNDLTSILCFVNNNLEIGSFGFNEFESTLHFKYNWMCRQDQIDPQLIMGVLGMMIFYIDSQFPSIAAIGEGKESYLSFLKRLSDLWKEVEQK